MRQTLQFSDQLTTYIRLAGSSAGFICVRNCSFAASKNSRRGNWIFNRIQLDSWNL